MFLFTLHASGHLFLFVLLLKFFIFILKITLEQFEIYRKVAKRVQEVFMYTTPSFPYWELY